MSLSMHSIEWGIRENVGIWENTSLGWPCYLSILRSPVTLMDRNYQLADGWFASSIHQCHFHFDIYGWLVHPGNKAAIKLKEEIPSISSLPSIVLFWAMCLCVGFYIMKIVKFRQWKFCYLPSNCNNCFPQIHVPAWEKIFDVRILSSICTRSD